MVFRAPAEGLSGFDFSAGEVNEALVRQLYRCEFMEAAENVVLIGGPGTGKSHVATAIGVQAIGQYRIARAFGSVISTTSL
jgi:DNA replication protein DnaC